MLKSENGVRRTEIGVYCESCGNDLSVEGSSEWVSHWDGIKEYGYNFKCTKCGAIHSQVYERTAEDAKWWGAEEEPEKGVTT